MGMEVMTENGEITLPYLLHGGESEVQVAHGRLWETFSCLTLFEEGKTAAGLLTGISHLQREHCFFSCTLFLHMVEVTSFDENPSSLT